MSSNDKQEYYQVQKTIPASALFCLIYSHGADVKASTSTKLKANVE